MRGKIKNIVIIGGGTAGWMTAAGLANALHGKDINCTLVESEQIGTVGVGEATLPHIRYFNRTLGICEKDFMKKTNATIKLGIEFKNWGRIGDSYIHPFGDYGSPLNGIDFHHYWQRYNQLGGTEPLDAFSVPIVAAVQNRCDYPSSDPQSLASTYSYAFQFDAGLYAAYLRDYSETRGVKRVEGFIQSVSQDTESGAINSVTLKDGAIIEGDLFIDCSGFRGLLINQTLKSDFQDWSHWLPCDRAYAVACDSAGDFTPYTRATAQEAGWQWRIPLQSRTGNGYVFSSKYISEDQACQSLLDNIDGPSHSDPKLLKFQAGYRPEGWKKNCVSIGLSSGFLEPLESTSIYLIQIALTKLIELFPEHGCCDRDADEFNRVMNNEYSRIRDFLILHYYATEREDSQFWRDIRSMEIPESLQYKMDLFKKRGSIIRYDDGLFLHPSWVAVYLGQRIMPDNIHPLAYQMPDDALMHNLTSMAHRIQQEVKKMPRHKDFIQMHCPADLTAASQNKSMMP